MTTATEGRVDSCALTLRFQAPVVGRGFLAFVRMRARILADLSVPGCYYLWGVNPGSISVYGLQEEELGDEPFLRFKNAMLEQLAHSANRAKDFNEFKTFVEGHFTEPGGDVADEWEAARMQPDAVRAALLDRLDLSVGTRFRPFLAVKRISRPTPYMNVSAVLEMAPRG